MHRAKIILVVLITALLIGDLSAQTSTYKGKKLPAKRSYNNPTLSRAKTGSSKVIFDVAGYPYQGIGIKVGDPFALTWKFYFSERIALGADFGRSLSSLYSSYYESRYEALFPDPLETYSYDSHKVTKDWVGELKLSYHVDASSLSKGLRFYGGLGWQIRNTSLEYTYVTNPPNEPATIVERRSYPTQGVVICVGMEHTARNAPIILFVELETYYDMMKNPGWIRLQGGVGIRYIF